MSCTRFAEPAAEAKKAEGASRVALRTPKHQQLFSTLCECSLVLLLE